MKTTKATLHDDIAAAVGCDDFIDINCDIGSPRWAYLQNEVTKMHNADPSDIAEIGGFLTDAQRAQAEDLMTMATVAQRDRLPENLVARAEEPDVPPMLYGKKKADSRLDRFLNGMLGVMVAAMALCVLILMFVWV